MILFPTMILLSIIDSNVVIQCQLPFHEEKLNLLHWKIVIEKQYRLGQFELFVKKLEMDD
jgi:hypothetical protein